MREPSCAAAARVAAHFRRRCRPHPGAAAIVTLVKDVELSDFVTYHLAIGFAHIFIFFDDPDELDWSLAERHPFKLTLLPVDAALHDAWRSQLHGGMLLSGQGPGINARQELCANHAMGLALRRGDLRWLLHLDSDELFHPGACGSAPSHFAALGEQGVACFTYINHEAVPEAANGVTCPFVQLSLFKRHVDAIPRTVAARAAGAVWSRRLGRGAFFVAYDGGKSAVRVHEGARLLSPHEWSPAEELLPGARTNMVSPLAVGHVARHNRAAAEALRAAVRFHHSDACVLHYPVPTADQLWRRWRRGNFPPALCRLYEGLVSGRGAGAASHAPAAPADQAAVTEAAARAAVTRLFRDAIVMEEGAEMQISSGVCARFGSPREILMRARAAQLLRLELPALLGASATGAAALAAALARCCVGQTAPLCRALAAAALPPRVPASRASDAASAPPGPCVVRGPPPVRAVLSAGGSVAAAAAAVALASQGYVVCTGGSHSHLLSSARALIGGMERARTVSPRQLRAARLLEGADALRGTLPVGGTALDEAIGGGPTVPQSHSPTVPQPYSPTAPQPYTALGKAVGGAAVAPYAEAVAAGRAARADGCVSVPGVAGATGDASGDGGGDAGDAGDVDGAALSLVDAALSGFAAELVRALAALPADAAAFPFGRAEDGQPFVMSARTELQVQCLGGGGGGGSYSPHVDNSTGDGRSTDFGRVLTVLYYLNDGWDAKGDGGQLRIYLPSGGAPRARAAAAAAAETAAERAAETAGAEAAAAQEPQRGETRSRQRHATDIAEAAPALEQPPALEAPALEAPALEPPAVDVVEVAPEEDTLVVFRADRLLHEVRPTRRRRVALQIWIYCRSTSSEPDLAVQAGSGPSGVRAARLYPGVHYAHAVRRALDDHTEVPVTAGKGNSARGQLWVSAAPS